MSADLIKRLEAVAARLESYASSLGSGASSSSSSGSEAKTSEAALIWDSTVQPSIDAFLAAARADANTADLAKHTETVIGVIKNVINAASSCSKPSQADLQKFFEPAQQAIQACSEPALKSPVYDQLKAFAEASVAFLWPLTGPPGDLPRPFIQNQLEASDFYLVKVLNASKKAEGAKKDQMAAFATTLKKALQDMCEFVGANFKTGLEWNPKGTPLSQFGGAAAAAPRVGGGAPPPPPGPAPDIAAMMAADKAASNSVSSSSGSASSAGLGAVFGELTGKGDGVTAGLRKVTADMKTKNMKDVPTLAPKAAEPAAPKKVEAKAAAPKKPAVTECRKGTWFVEYYEGATVQIPDELDIKEGVYIVGCKNTNVIVPKKCKTVQVDSCIRTHVTFTTVVSVVTAVNCQRLHIEATEAYNSIALDKTAGASIILSRAGAANPPTIVTSNVSELNLVVPGKTDDDDPIEIPLPEQYETKLIPGTTKLVTEPVSHSGG